MPETGLEPARAWLAHQPLKLARLPIPPLRPRPSSRFQRFPHHEDRVGRCQVSFGLSGRLNTSNPPARSRGPCSSSPERFRRGGRTGPQSTPISPIAAFDADHESVTAEHLDHPRGLELANPGRFHVALREIHGQSPIERAGEVVGATHRPDDPQAQPRQQELIEAEEDVQPQVLEVDALLQLDQVRCARTSALPGSGPAACASRRNCEVESRTFVMPGIS